MLKVLYTAIYLMAASSYVFAQVEIVESTPIGGSDIRNAQMQQPQANNSQPNSVDANAQSEFYYQMQMLQQEVQQLRGIVDEQAHEIRRLKQQQLDDYVDLDRRVSQLSKGKGSAGLQKRPKQPANAPAGPAEAPKPAGDTGRSAKEELADYDKAVRLILKQKDLEAGADLMLIYLTDYPNGVYVSNAQYWLGQVAFSSDDLAEAKKWFSQVLQTNPSSQKAPEAKYKLGLVLYRLGELAEAKKLLTEVAGTSSSAASLAEKFIRNNF